MNLNLQHWAVAVDGDGLATATLNKAGESANSLSVAVMSELAQIPDAGCGSWSLPGRRA
jgi:3-hydroxyacyl-CoA dehydrogenase/enoyl-CoA hydratase/3-hydroxybutyryl-CoA epimerase